MVGPCYFCQCSSLQIGLLYFFVLKNVSLFHCYVVVNWLDSYLYRTLERMTKTCHLIVWLVHIYYKLLRYALYLSLITEHMFVWLTSRYIKKRHGSFVAHSELLNLVVVLSWTLIPNFQLSAWENLGCYDWKRNVILMDLLISRMMYEHL